MVWSSSELMRPGRVWLLVCVLSCVALAGCTRRSGWGGRAHSTNNLTQTGGALTAKGGTRGQTGGVAGSSSPGGDPLAKAKAFYASRPVYERPHPHSPPPKGLGDMRAETCGACHKAIYEEWKVSTHSQAWLGDAQFQEELKKSRGAHDPKSGDVGWLCVNCHTPVMNQLEEVVVGLSGGAINRPVYAKNPAFDKKLQHDAITCATCHVRDGAVLGPYGGTGAPHAVVKSDRLRTEQVCTRCHQAEAAYPAQNLQCFFATGREWAKSEHGAQQKTCQECHMPEVTRRVAEAFDLPPRKTRRHWFGGSLIPKHPRYAEALKKLRPVFGSGATIRVRAATKEARALARTQTAPSWPKALKPSPSSCVAGSLCARVWVEVRNDRAGHHFPTGDPERHVVVEATVRRGDVVVTTARDLIGSRYRWWPKIELLADTRIPSGAARALIVEIPDVKAPKKGAKQPLTLTVTADKFRMYADAFEHHKLAGRYVRGRRFHTSRWTLGPDGVWALVSIEDDHGARTTLAP